MARGIIIDYDYLTKNMSENLVIQIIFINFALVIRE
jgi:hypothetical protein